MVNLVISLSVRKSGIWTVFENIASVFKPLASGQTQTNLWPGTLVGMDPSQLHANLGSLGYPGGGGGIAKIAEDCPKIDN